MALMVRMNVMKPKGKGVCSVCVRQRKLCVCRHVCMCVKVVKCVSVRVCNRRGSGATVVCGVCGACMCKASTTPRPNRHYEAMAR